MREIDWILLWEDLAEEIKKKAYWDSSEIIDLMAELKREAFEATKEH